MSVFCGSLFVAADLEDCARLVEDNEVPTVSVKCKYGSLCN